METVTIFDDEIPLLGSTESQCPSVNTQCLVTDFIYVSKSDKKKLHRANINSRNKTPFVKIVDEFAEFESNSRVDSLLVHDQVKIPVVSKMKAKTNINKKQDRQKQTVHILSDITVPATRCMPAD